MSQAWLRGASDVINPTSKRGSSRTGKRLEDAGKGERSESHCEMRQSTCKRQTDGFSKRPRAETSARSRSVFQTG